MVVFDPHSPPHTLTTFDPNAYNYDVCLFLGCTNSLRCLILCNTCGYFGNSIIIPMPRFKEQYY